MKRWTEPATEHQPRAAAAGRLLARVAPPAAWTAERQARIAAALRARPARRAGWIWAGRAAVGALAAIAVFALVPRREPKPRPPVTIAPVAAVAPTPESPAPPPPAPLPAPAPATEPAVAASPSAPARPRSRTVTLRTGQLVLDGRDGNVVVATSRARIEIPRGGRAEVGVHGDTVRVASMQRPVIVHWIASDARIEVAPGEIWTSELLAPAAPPPSPSALTEETRLVEQILAARRTDPSGTAALALLDEYARRYPDGTFALEAQTLRVDVLVRTGNPTAALALLDAMALDRVPRGLELRVLRGELRVRAQRPRDALDDFDQVLRDAVGQLAARARNGRAAAHAALQKP